MSRLAAPSRHIYVTSVRQAGGNNEVILSSAELGNESVRVNRKWSEASKTAGTLTCNNGFVLYALMNLYLHGQDNTLLSKAYINKLPHDLWVNIFEFVLPTFGIQKTDFLFRDIAHYASAVRKPLLFQNKVEMDPYIIVDAAMRGQEDMVMNILNADPSYLLKKSVVKNSVDVEYEVTPLEAAIMTTDVQMIERMKPHFDRLTVNLQGRPINGLDEMHRQIKETYKKSLRRYCKTQQEKIAALKTPQANEQSISRDELKTEKKYLTFYERAIATDNFDSIFKVHQAAQKHNTFDFQPYVNAILRASDAELDDVIALLDAQTAEETEAAIAKGVSPIEIGFTDQHGRTYSREAVQALSLDQLTLIQKLNRFREKFVAHKREELMDNSAHILAVLKHNEDVWNENFFARIVDPDYVKHSVIFSQLAGWAQRKAAEPVKQDLRQGIYLITVEQACHTRPAHFSLSNINHWLTRNPFSDCSLIAPSVIDGIGYKFWADAVAVCLGTAGVYLWMGDVPAPTSSLFLHLMSIKYNKLLELVQQPTRNHRQGCMGCVVS